MSHQARLSVVWLVSLLCAAAAVHEAQCKTVIVIPTPFTSHVKHHVHVARELSKLGHQVWVAIPSDIAEKGYLDTSGLGVIHYEGLPQLEERAMAVLPDRYFKGKSQRVTDAFGLMTEQYDSFLTNHTFIETIRTLKPDLIVIDNVACMYPLAIIAYKLNIPFAFFGFQYAPIIQRIPFSPAETPVIYFPFSNRMSFAERLQMFILCLASMMSDFVLPTNAVSVYAPEMPYLPLNVLLGRAEVWLLEMDHIMDYPRPTVPNVKMVGGTATGPAKPLPPHFASFMDSATEGVVIVSFGSYVLNLPLGISHKLLQVFTQLPMKVVIRANLTSPDPSKIMTSEWLPQNDLLGHPNTKVFVSHCGNGAQYEALYHAVPIVATPLFADQPYNAERVRSKGFAEVLDLKSCSVQELTDAILTVALEPKYKETIAKYSRLFQQQFGVPEEKAAFWLDHVMEFGGDYMRTVGQEMPFYEFFMLDIILFILLLLAAFVTLFSICVCGVCSVAKRQKRKND